MWDVTMHDLEYQLHKLAVRMEKRGRKKLAEELFTLASASHNYVPDFPDPEDKPDTAN